jgi:hypothetical protein
MCLGVHVLGLQPGRVRLQVHHQPEGHEQGAGGGQVHLCPLDQLIPRQHAIIKSAANKPVSSHLLEEKQNTSTTLKIFMSVI